MMTAAVMLPTTIALLLLSCAHARQCFVAKNENFYLSLTSDQLFAEATGGKKVGSCFIQQSGGSCDLYVKSAVRGARGDYGWPKTRDMRGTGCVRAPDFPRRVTACYYTNPAYGLSWTTVATFCTNSGKKNAAAQLRHAIRAGACGLPRTAAYYLGLDEAALFAAATGRSRVGNCYVQQGGPGAACGLYVKSAVRGADGDYGWPKTAARRRGTGCVRAPDFPKSVRACYYNDARYVLCSSFRKAFCTDSGRANAVAQLRHAISHAACELPVVPHTPCASGSPGCRCY